PSAVAASVHSAARTPRTLFAAIEAPVPVQQKRTAVSAAPDATSSPTRRPTAAHSSSVPAGDPTSSTAWPRTARSAATASVRGVVSSDPSATRIPSRYSSFTDQRRPHVGEPVEGDEGHTARGAPARQRALREQGVREERRLAVARPVADEHRRAPAAGRVLDRCLLAHAAARTRAAAVLVGELESPGLPVDGIRVDGDVDSEPRARVVHVEPEPV